MTASRLLSLLASVQFTWWDAPSRTGRLPFDVLRCPLRSAVFACFGVPQGGRCASNQGVESCNLSPLTDIVTTACEGGLPHDDLPRLAPDFASKLPMSVPPTLFRGDSEAGSGGIREWIPY